MDEVGTDKVSGPDEKETTASRVGIEPRLLAQLAIGGRDGRDLYETGRLKVR